MTTEPNTEPTAASTETNESPQGAVVPEAAEAKDGSSSSHQAGEGALASDAATAASSESDADEEGGEEGTAETAQAEGENKGEGKKRRRRRRRKKPGVNAEAAAGEGATPAEGTEASENKDAEQKAQGEGDKRNLRDKHDKRDKRDKRDNDKGKKKHKPREPRERPPFGVGELVFGKVTDVTFHCLFIDLSGKGTAIFDRRELELPDEPIDVNSIREQAKAEEAERASEEKTASPPEANEGAAVSGEAADAQADAAAQDGAAQAAPPAEAAASNEAAAASGDSSAEGAAEAAPEGAAAKSSDEASGKDKKKAEPVLQQLPPVLCEEGAHFVGFIHNDGGRGGLIVLTRHPRRAARAKPMVSSAFREKKEVSGLVTGVIKGGVEVDLDGLRAFAPASQVDLKPGADLSPLVGKRLSFAVTQYAKQGRDLVLSRRATLEAEAKAHRDEAIGKLEMGAVVDGVVKTVLGFGTFVDVGGVEGLVPREESSHNRGEAPSDVFKVGDTVQVKIVRVDEKGKLWLSRKAATPNPWDEVSKKYATGTKHTGKVARLQPFGAFIELESGIDGLIHVQDLSIKRIEHPNEVVKEGDSIEVVVSHVDPGAHKIGLHPALQGEEANEQRQKLVLHKPVKAVVVAAEASGLVVRIRGATGRHARAFIPAAATGLPRGAELRKDFPPGKEVEAKVMEMDPRRGEVKLSIRALREDNERTFYKQYRDQANRENKFGTFGDLFAKKLQQ